VLPRLTIVVLTLFFACNYAEAGPILELGEHQTEISDAAVQSFLAAMVDSNESAAPLDLGVIRWPGIDGNTGNLQQMPDSANDGQAFPTLYSNSRLTRVLALGNGVLPSSPVLDGLLKPG
jgi:hypothetical protein